MISQAGSRVGGRLGPSPSSPLRPRAPGPLGSALPLSPGSTGTELRDPVPPEMRPCDMSGALEDFLYSPGISVYSRDLLGKL